MEIESGKSVEEREDEGTVVHVEDELGEQQFYPEGKPREEQKPVTITVVGTYSKRYRKAESKGREKIRTGGRRALKGQESDERELALMAECIIEWEGFTIKGEPIPFSTKNAVVLLKANPFIRDQLTEAMNDHERFFKARSTS